MSGPLASLRVTVILLALAGFLIGASTRICDGLIPRLARDFQISSGSAGGVVIWFMVAYCVMQLMFGPLGDRYGKARMVTVALAGCGVAAIACAAAPSFETLLVLRVGWGMAAAGVIPLAFAWIGDAVPPEKLQPTLAHLLLGTLTGMMAGQLMGGLFADSAWGWRGAFATLAAGYLLVALMLVLLLRAPVAAPAAPAPAGILAGMHAVWRTAWARRVLLAGCVEGCFLLGPMAYLPDYLHRRYGLTLAAASSLLALYAVGGLLYAANARRIVRLSGQRSMVLAGGWIMGVGYLAWLLSPWSWTAGPVALAVGFGAYLYHNTLQTHATQMAPAVRGSAVALFAFCFFFGQAVGTALAGFAYDHGGAAWMILPSALALPLAGWGFARALGTYSQAQRLSPSER